MKQVFCLLLIAALAIGTSPESVLRLSPATDSAVAGPRGHGGGFSRAPRANPGGARARPSHGAGRPATGRPSAQPARPAAPAQRPAVQPANPGSPITRPARPANRPEGARPPGNRPPGARPPGSRPPGTRPPGSKPPGARPPGSRPPGARPPVARPPGWRPPNSRPPGWRPPYYPPPYPRPPHYYWGDYYWSPNWGWFFTAALVGSTLVYVTSLPDDTGCEPVQSEGETLYNCNGVLYRSTYYKDEKVYEIVSEDPDESQSEPASVIGLSLTDPLTRGEIVRDLQNRLVGAGYDVGTVDGVYGSGTANAVEWFQYDNELEVTGAIDAPTAEALGFRPQGSGTETPASPPESGATAEPEQSQDGSSPPEGTDSAAPSD